MYVCMHMLTQRPCAIMCSLPGSARSARTTTATGSMACAPPRAASTTELPSKIRWARPQGPYSSLRGGGLDPAVES